MIISLIVVFAIREVVSQLHYVGSEFPNCVDVVNVDPPPFSTLLEDSFSITITFSRSISRDIWPKLLSSSRPLVFLSWNSHLIEMKGIKPTSIVPKGTSWRKVECKFTISHQDRRIYKKLHLVVDGNRFVTMDFAFDKLQQTSVSLSIFGEYYLLENIPNKRSPYDWVPTPFCGTQIVRPLPDPYLEDVGSELNVTLLDNNFLQQSETDGFAGLNYTLYLSITMIGTGTKQVTLPSTAKALYMGVNVSVMIPVATTLTVTKQDGWYEIPVVRIRPVHETYEKVYHSNITRLIPAHKGFYSLVPTNSDEFIRRSRWYNYMYHNSIMYAQNKYCYWGFDWSLFSTFDIKSYGAFTRGYRYKPFMRQCDPSSRRTKTTGRSGLTYHAIEPGVLYMLMQMSQNTMRWKTGRSHHRYLVNGQDVTRFSQGTKWNGIPDKVINAVKKYLFLTPPIRLGYYYFPLDSAIFVPNNQAHHNCNGVLFNNNIGSLQYDPRFCERKFGTCLGLPFASIKRFPAIPPFGISEFAGWTGNKAKMPHRIFNRRHSLHHIQHPMGRHFNQSAVPRAVLLVKHEENSYTATVYLSAHDGFNLDAHNIPIGGVKILRSDFGFSAPDICGRVLTLEETLAYETSITVQVKNSEQGGADLTITMNCSSLLKIHHLSNSTIKQWINPGSSSEFRFTVEVREKALSVKKQSHTCTLTIIVHTLHSHPQQRLTCTRPVTTYFGFFQDPCMSKAQPLPTLDLKYFVLPTSQRTSAAESLASFLQSDAGRDYVFMKAIAVIVKVSVEEESLLENLKELRIQCRHKDIMIFEEEQLKHKAKLHLTADHNTATPSPILVYTSLLARRRVYFFAKKEWVMHYESPPEDVPELELASVCSIEVVVNRPNKLCDHPTVVQAAHVPLVEIDISAFEVLERSQYWYLEPLYGPQSDETMLLLLSCIVISVLMFACTILGHGGLLIFHKHFPNAKRLAKLKKQLYRSQATEKRKWENPQMFLELNKLGPFYMLYDFKCTDELDSNLDALKLAGVLRYEDKELQVLFGHIKKVFLSNSAPRNIWVQASSGMYLLAPQNVHGEYKENLESFYKRQGARVMFH